MPKEFTDAEKQAIRADAAERFDFRLPELFGGEMRLISSVDFQNGKIVRWVDYWDGRHFGSALTNSLRTPANQWPVDFGENIVNYYKYCRDRDLFLTHALGDPQVDRSTQPQNEQRSTPEDEEIALHVVEEGTPDQPGLFR